MDEKKQKELVEELAKERTVSIQSKAEIQRCNSTIDRLLNENEELKQQLQQHQGLKEKTEEDKKRICEIEKELNIIKSTKFYLSQVGMDEKLAEETAKAEISGDKDKVYENIAIHIKAIKDTAYQKALSERPEPKITYRNVCENSSEMAIAAAAEYARKNGVNMDILNQY